MANEIEKTIEELEAEVLSELEEQSADAPKKGAAPAEPALKASDASSVTPGGEVQDMGPAVTSPTDKSGPGTQAGKKAKEASGDAAQKKEGKPDSMDTPNDGEKKVAKSLAAGDEVEMTDDQETISEKEKTDEGMHDDKKEGMHGEMSKMEMIKAMKDMETEMKEMDKKMVMSMYSKMKEMMAKEMSHEESEKEALKKEAVEQRIKEINVQEHVEALMSGEGDLSDDFKKKAATVFESAVKSKVRDEVTRLQENYDSELEEATKSVKSDLTEKVDTYLNYVVEEWMKENELAVERGLKGEIAEDFIAGLKQLFEDHYVDVPDEKYDVLQAQSDKIAELEEKVNKTLEESINFKKSNDELTRNKVISESTSDLADTEIEKFKELTQDVEFEDEDNFKEKLDTLKESYFPKVKKEASETIDNVETGPAQDIDLTDSMAAYTKAISNHGKGFDKGATK
tara:strand:- start:7 stop:1371 length:1365 start_codon:yes stop_codon:yes gene_type:complete